MSEETINERAVALRVLLGTRGVSDTKDPIGDGARLLGYVDESDMVFTLLTRTGARKRERGNTGGKEVETEADRNQPDDEFLVALEAACENEPEGVRAPDWRKMMEGLVTTAGFYARVERLVAAGLVLVRKEKRETKLYGKMRVANVSLYLSNSKEAQAERAQKEGGAK